VQTIDVGSTSRRALLGLLASAPIATLTCAKFENGRTPVGILDQPIALRRTREGRQLSRVRYHTAESFLAPIDQRFLTGQSDLLYQTGIVLQLALSSYLIDVGFDDGWCAMNIGLHVDKSFNYANATGLGHQSPELARLAEFVSPYGRWRNPHAATRAIPCPFSQEQICELARELLERVREVTDHPRPRTRGR
jgi:hypothetical protein